MQHNETESNPGRELTVTPAARTPTRSTTLASPIVVPAILADAGDRAAKRFLEFFGATIRNKNTRMAYYRAGCRFFAGAVFGDDRLPNRQVHYLSHPMLSLEPCPGGEAR